MDDVAAPTTALPAANETESLILKLNTKLVELDQKVLLYRRDMAKQFSKFTEERLKGESEEVRQQVAEAVRDRLKKSSLADIPEDAIAPVASPPLAGNLEVTKVGGQIANQASREMAQETREGRRSAPVAILDVEGEEDIPRSPHARENEFLGVFTQGYLPLLDSNKQYERRSGSIASSDGEGTAALPIRRPQSAEEGQSQGLSVSYSPPRSGPHPNKPDHQRRHTGDGASLSDPESHKPRRSALRRTSSNSSGKAHSLRKVRFEFAGVEFPTTSSPSVVETPLSTADAADLPLSSLSSSAVNDDESDAPESEQVEFIEDIDDEEPAPRRISSSQALRMLSRGPIEDDGTHWEEVVAPEDGSPSVAVEQANLDSDDADVLSLGSKGSRSDELKSPSPPQSPTEKEVDEEAPQVEQQEEITPEEKAEEEDILADMTPLAPMHSTRSVMGNNASVTTTTALTSFATGVPIPGIPTSESTAVQQPLHDMSPVKSETTTNIPSSGSLAQLPRKKQKAKAFILPEDSDDDDLPFEFEDNSGTSSTPRKQQRPPSPIEDDDESDTSSESPMSPERGVPGSLSMYATSPARNIAGQEATVISPTTLNTFNNSNLPGAGSLKPTGTFGSLRRENSSLSRAQGDAALSSTPIPAGGGGTATPPMQAGSLRNSANMMGREGGSSLRNSWHPFQIPVVDPRLNEKAKQWGEDRSFVGSVSGRTGLDEWDGVGYAGSLRGQGGGSLRQTSGGRVIPQRDPQQGGRGRGGSVTLVGSAGGGKPMSFSQRMEEEEKAAEWERQRKGRGN